MHIIYNSVIQYQNYLTRPIVVGSQNNRLKETILLSTHNIGFNPQILKDCRTGIAHLILQLCDQVLKFGKAASCLERLMLSTDVRKPELT